MIVGLKSPLTIPSKQVLKGLASLEKDTPRPGSQHKDLFVQEDKGLPLGRAETDVAHRQMAVYKGKGKPLVKMSWFILIGYVNYIWKPNSPVQD